MVRGFAMDSQDKRICKAESTFSGDYNHRLYDEDCFSDILNIFDFPMESLEADGLAEDWASKLGPIPSEFFRELLPPPASQTGGGSSTDLPETGGGSSADLPFEYPILNNMPSQLKPELNLSKEQKPYPLNTPSPNSVLESRSSSSNNKTISFGDEITIPVRTRTKRKRPTTTLWRLSPPAAPPTANKKQEKPPTGGIKKCAHCEITRTPQWREGPMGPRTLCNACGVRYRSGRLYPEYRPAASPTFVPSLHSNSHRRVVEMRRKTVE